MRARIKEKWEVAKGTLLVSFDLLGEEVDFSPGQYFFVTLPDIGYQDDRGLRGHITVVTSPNEKGVLGFATRMRDSAFKRSLGELPVGAEVDVESPKGNFVLPENTSRPLVFVAGGIGITVFRSMLRYIREERLPYRVTLIYSNRDRESTAFLDELREFEQALPDFRLILTMTQDPGWKGETRKVDGKFVKDHLDEDLNRYTFLVAGPPAMAEGMQQALEEAGVQDENVIAERYSGY
jgi:ferredoxin-NADP reductase